MVDQFGVEEAHKVPVEPFVLTDEFVAKSEASHESALLEPEYGVERARKKMSLTAANAIIRSAILVLVELHRLRAQLALR